MAIKEYEPIYTVSEAAKLLRTNKNFVYDEIRRGNLPGLKIGSMKVRGADLEKYIQSYPIADLVEEERINDCE